MKQIQEENFTEEIINERQKDVDHIEKLVYGLRDMVVDASKEISKQGESIGILKIIIFD